MRRTVAVVETPLVAGEGLASWLAAQPGFSARGAADWREVGDADVVLLDLSRGERHAHALLEEAPRQPIPLVAIDSKAHPVPGHWKSWLGASAVLTVPVPADHLLAALHGAASPAPAQTPEPAADPDLDWLGDWDGVYFQAPLAQEAASAGPGQALTRREREIARLVSLGLSNREIGERLFVAVGTVRKHRENLMNKLEIRSALGLTQWALGAGLISKEEFATSTQPDRRKP